MSEDLRSVHMLELVELAEQAYGPKVAHLLRVGVWAITVGRAEPETVGDWLKLAAFGPTGQRMLAEELDAHGHVTAFTTRPGEVP